MKKILISGKGKVSTLTALELIQKDNIKNLQIDDRIENLKKKTNKQIEGQINQNAFDIEQERNF